MEVLTSPLFDKAMANVEARAQIARAVSMSSSARKKAPPTVYIDGKKYLVVIGRGRKVKTPPVKQ